MVLLTKPFKVKPRNVVLPPLPARLDTANTAPFLRRELQRNVRIALNLARSAGPRPRRVPGDRAPAQRVQPRALLAAGVVALAPEVIVQDVAARRRSAPLLAGIRAAGEGLCFGWDGCGIAQASQGQG